MKNYRVLIVFVEHICKLILEIKIIWTKKLIYCNINWNTLIINNEKNIDFNISDLIYKKIVSVKIN